MGTLILVLNGALWYFCGEGQLNISDRMNAKKQAGNAPNAQNKSIGDYGSEGLGFESLRARSLANYLLLDPFFAKIKIRTRAIATTSNSIELSFGSIYA